jgi:hypothetical protein
MTTLAAAVLVLLGVLLGPRGLAMLPRSALLMLDPIVAMALAAVGVLVGLGVDPHRPRLTLPLTIVMAGGVALVVFRQSSPGPVLVTTLAIAAISIIVAFATWLLIGQTDSAREQRVFVIGALLLLGGAAAYLSLSALFAGVLAGAVWSAAGNLAKARIVNDLDYLQHPLLVLMLLVAGASAGPSIELALIAVAIAAIHLTARSFAVATPLPPVLIATALALDIFRGVTGR